MDWSEDNVRRITLSIADKTVNLVPWMLGVSKNHNRNLFHRLRRLLVLGRGEMSQFTATGQAVDGWRARFDNGICVG
jgi:uncharacterized protein YigA (DUF484 family)